LERAGWHHDDASTCIASTLDIPATRIYRFLYLCRPWRSKSLRVHRSAGDCHRIVHFTGVERPPTAWTTQENIEALPADTTPNYLLCSGLIPQKPEGMH